VARFSGSAQPALDIEVGLSREIHTLIDLIRWRAQKTPDKVAASFLLDENEEIVLTYQGIDQKARAIASLLQDFHCRNERALLVFPPGLDFITAFFGCLYSQTVAAPTYPPHPARLNRSLPRLQGIAKDSQPIVALTTSDILANLDELLAHSPELEAMHWLATDKIPLDLAAEWKEPEISSETLAFLQYTSGSTAQPKGVMVSHGNLLHNSSLIQDFFETNEDSRGVFWLPSYHDMGLVGGILQTFYCGGNVTLMSPLTFLQHPFRWLQAISRKSATVSGGPNFAYDLCVRKVTEDQKKTIDLSCWRLAFNGAEPIRHDTLKRFADAFAGCGFREEAFYPCYGLAEGTLIVSGAKLSTPPLCKAFDESSLEQHIAHEVDSSDPDSRILVSCGNIPQDQEVQIVDPDTLMALPPGRIGEIWVMGPSVAKGYWNHLEETERTFQAHIAPAGEGPFLRTGDLGFFLDGELFVTGRLKDLIIIEGRNHYPQDIEITVEAAHPAIRPAGTAVFTTEMGGHDKLTVVAEVEPKFLRGLSRSNGTNGTHKSEIDEKEVIRAIRRAVAEHHDIQVHAVALLKPGKLPKTSSGKVQRHASAAGFLAGTLDRI